MKIAYYYSHHHLEWASFFARRAAEIESEAEENDDWRETVGDDEIQGHILHEGYVINASIGAFSFLDALANEVVDQVMRGIEVSVDGDSTTSLAETPGGTLLLLDEIGRNPFESNPPTLVKFQMLLAFMLKRPFDQGSQPFQNVNTVRRLRNHFVHYEPEMRVVDFESNHVEHDLGSALQGKFDENPLIDKTGRNDLRRWLSSDCAQWSIQSCLDFAEEFHERIDEQERFKSFYS